MWRASLLLLPIAACVFPLRSVAQTNETPRLIPRAVIPPIVSGPLLMGPGDLIEVQVFQTPELSAKIRVDQAGTINLPAGGQIQVEGMTAAQVGVAIEKILRESQIMLDPHVTVFADEYATQGITLLGEVRSPGTYTLLGAHSLYEALSVAGGVTANEGSSITITHRDDPDHPTVVKVNSANYSELQRSTVVEPGDTVLVAKADMIYVVGDVGHPGAYYLQNGEPLSVLNALALASGLNHTAAVSKASIVRQTSAGAQTIPLDLNRIMKNTNPNVILQAADIIVVPRSGVKVLMETAVPGATTAVMSAVSTALILR
jgi:polysaccharide export outer membrane protein